MKKLRDIFYSTDLSFSHLAATGLCLFSSLFTADILANNTGFYIGGGINHTQLTYSYRAIEMDLQFGPQDQNQSHASGNGAGGQLLVGYTWLLADHKYFISANAFVDFRSLDAERSWSNTAVAGATSTISATVKNGYGLSVKPGITINDNFRLFTELGLTFSQLNNIVYERGFFVPDSTSAVDLTKQNLYGVRLGLGGQYALGENLHAELSWALTYYDDFAQSQPSDFSDVGAITKMSTVDFNAIHTNQFLFNLVYYFK